MSTRPVILLDGAASAPSEVLGHKGHGIDMMRRNGLPVPPAFCLTAEVGARYRAEPKRPSTKSGMTFSMESAHWKRRPRGLSGADHVRC